ncbi:hypothetical protein CR513_00125, partial [Mucuna pruriens]
MSRAASIHHLAEVVSIVILLITRCETVTSVSCSTVFEEVAPCTGFLQESSKKPSEACCSGVKKISDEAGTREDRTAICECLKKGLAQIGNYDPQQQLHDMNVHLWAAATGNLTGKYYKGSIKLNDAISFKVTLQEMHLGVLFFSYSSFSMNPKWTILVLKNQHNLPVQDWYIFKETVRSALAANLDAYTVAPRLRVDPSSSAKASCSLSCASYNDLSIFFFQYRRHAACMKQAAHVFHCEE